MSLLSPSQGIRRWPSMTSYFQRGTNPLETWYACGVQNQTALSAGTIAISALNAIPFAVSRQILLDRIGFFLSTGGGAGSKARVGIYSTSGYYPTNLVVDGGEISTIAGLEGAKSSVISATLSPGLYWAAWLGGSANCNPSTIVATGLTSIFGSTSSLSTLAARMTVALAYGALPVSFPAGGAVSTTVGPAVMLRISA